MQESRRFDDAKISVKVQSTATCFVVLLTISLENHKTRREKSQERRVGAEGQMVEKFFVILQRN